MEGEEEGRAALLPGNLSVVASVVNDKSKHINTVSRPVCVDG